MEQCLCGRKIWNRKFRYKERLMEDKYFIMCQICFEEATRSKDDKYT